MSAMRKENKKTVRESAGAARNHQRISDGIPSGTGNFPVRNRIIAGMPLAVVIAEGKQHSGSLITARLRMAFGREVFGVPGNVTPEVSFAANQLIKQGAKLVTSAEDVIEELRAPVRAALVQAEAVEADQRNLPVADWLTPTEAKTYRLLNAEEPRHTDDIVETTGLNSSEVLATLFNLEIKALYGNCRESSLARRCCSVSDPPRSSDAPEMKLLASAIQQGRVGQNTYIR